MDEPDFESFIKKLSPLELVMLSHELRTHPEDKEKLDMVLRCLHVKWGEETL